MKSTTKQPFIDRLRGALDARERKGLLRSLRVADPDSNDVLNLADNDYLDLARDAAVIEAACQTARDVGCSATASPLITGYRKEHRELEETLQHWMDFPSALLWTSGFAANQALLSHLPGKDDLVIADRLIHHSMITGILRGNARLVRYSHNDIHALERLLQEKSASYETVFVATESVFSMDGDSPDLGAMAALKAKYPFIWILDEAHSIGWYGPQGAGLAKEYEVTASVDILVGTLGKTLGTQGAFTLFRDPVLREFLVNESGEFIFSTFLSPISAAAAGAAVQRCKELASEQPEWHAFSRKLRARLQEAGWAAGDGDSPVIPVLIGDAAETADVGTFLRERGLLTGTVRPPAVPPGKSRLRLSLKRTLHSNDANRLLENLEAFRQR